MSLDMLSLEVGKSISVALFMVAPRFAMALNGVFPSTPNLDLIPIQSPSDFVLEYLYGLPSITVYLKKN
jgi:hypothetical protein